jgi:hypothetical protein
MNTPEPTDTEGLKSTVKHVLYILKTHMTLPAGTDEDEVYAAKIAAHVHKNFVLKTDTKVTDLAAPDAEASTDVSNPASPPDQGTNELDEILTHFLVFTLGNKVIEANPVWARENARTELQTHIRRVTLEAQREGLRVVLELTRHSYDTRSPFANIENISNQVMVATNSCIITQIEAITKELQEIEGEQQK